MFFLVMLLAVLLVMLAVEWNAIGRAKILIGRTEVTPVACLRNAESMRFGFVI